MIPEPGRSLRSANVCFLCEERLQWSARNGMVRRFVEEIWH